MTYLEDLNVGVAGGDGEGFDECTAADGRVLLGAHEAHNVEQAAVGIVRSASPVVAILVESLALALCVADGEGRDLVEVEDGPVLWAVVRAVGEHVLCEEVLVGARVVRVLVLEDRALVNVELGEEDIVDVGVRRGVRVCGCEGRGGYRRGQCSCEHGSLSRRTSERAVREERESRRGGGRHRSAVAARLEVRAGVHSSVQPS